MTQPDFMNERGMRLAGSWGWKPGMESSLSSVAAGEAKAAGNHGPAEAGHASNGRERERDLVADAPVEVFVHGGRLVFREFSTITRGRAWRACECGGFGGVQPRKKTAMRKAELVNRGISPSI